MPFRLTSVALRLSELITNLIEVAVVSKLIKFNSALVSTVLDDLRIGPRDDVKMSIRNEVLTANVIRPDGRIHSVTTMLGHRFKRLTAISEKLDRADRRKVVKQLRKEGLSQSAVANLLGVSQGTVSLDERR